MTRYHVNRTTGTVGPCSAKRQCPFGDIETGHYDSEREARQAYEDENSSSLFAPKVHDSLKEMDADGLARDLLDRLSDFVDDPEFYSRTLEFTSVLHAHQKRRNRMNHATTPYIEHPLRVTLRLTKGGVRDESTIRAAMLHDSLEDGSIPFVKKFTDENTEDESEAREIMGRFITRLYGEDTNRIVQGVTNPLVDEETKATQTADEKNRAYYEHLKESVQSDKRIALVKMSDFIDNAGSLHHTDVPGQEAKTLKQAKKYLPCVDVFLDDLAEGNQYASQEAIDRWSGQLTRTKYRLRGIIDKYDTQS